MSMLALEPLHADYDAQQRDIRRLFDELGASFAETETCDTSDDPAFCEIMDSLTAMFA